MVREDEDAWMGSKRSFSKPRNLRRCDSPLKDSPTSRVPEIPTAIPVPRVIEEPTPKQRFVQEEIKKHLHEGVNVMRGFNWIFPPPSSTSTGRDDATNGFKKFLTGVTRMIAASQKLDQHQADRFVTCITRDLDREWPDILNFLATMGMQKKPLISQIKFVTVQLSKISPAFSAAARLASEQFNMDSERLEWESSPSIAASTAASRFDVFDEESALTVVEKNGWMRAGTYARTKTGMKKCGKISDGTIVRVIDDRDSTDEYAKVEVVCWVKKAYLKSYPLAEIEM